MCPGSNLEGFLYTSGLRCVGGVGGTAVFLWLAPCPLPVFGRSQGARALVPVSGRDTGLLLLPGGCLSAKRGSPGGGRTVISPHHPLPGAAERCPQGMHIPGLAGGRRAESVAALGFVSPHIPAQGSGCGPLYRAMPAPAAEATDRSMGVMKADAGIPDGTKPCSCSCSLSACGVHGLTPSALHQPGCTGPCEWRLPFCHLLPHSLTLFSRNG